MIQIKNLNLSFGGRTVFDDVSFVLDPQDRIGLVGLNGAGKSTLLKIIAKQQSIDSGSVLIPKTMNVAYMSQEEVLLTDKTVISEALTAFNEIDLEDELACVREATSMLEGLGFSQKMIEGRADALSVGWKMRLVLAKLLLCKADFYLFDEPTNHLDIFAKDWFITFLKRMKAGFLLVCHERYVLDEVVTKIADISHSYITVYQGNYSRFEKQKEEAEERQLAAYNQQQREIAQKKATIERFRASASKAKMAQSMIKALDKIELVQPPESMGKTLAVPRISVERAGRVVLTVENVSYAFGDRTIFEGISFVVERGEKVALVSANGMGKTTLLNAIAGEYKPKTGSIEFGYHVTPVYFHQDPNRSLNLSNTIFDEVMDVSGSRSELEVRALLGAFLFSGDDIHKKIKVLSGGEKNRVAMVKVLLQPANLLLLDEPTNHLDIPSKKILLKALQEYEGTILFVSHDHQFLNELPNRILVLRPNRVLSYKGNYEAYRYHEAHEIVASDQKSEARFSQKSSQEESNQTVSNKEIFLARKRIGSIEQRIEKLEMRINGMQKQLLELDHSTKEYTHLYDELLKMTVQHHELFAEWEQLQTIIQN